MNTFFSIYIFYFLSTFSKCEYFFFKDGDFNLSLLPSANSNCERCKKSLFFPHILPQNFSWSIIDFEKDDDDLIRKKQLINFPSSQKSCGSCLPTAFADTIGDKFVVNSQTQVDWKPEISSTHLMACSQLKEICKYGSSSNYLFDVLRKYYLVSNHCLDYSWCLTRNFSSGETCSDEFRPKLPICYFNVSHFVYRINGRSLVNIRANKNNYLTIQKRIKEHIFLHGPVVGSFVVVPTWYFDRGLFARYNINKGVFLEKMTFSSGSLNYMWINNVSDYQTGGHAVSIVGWGIERNVETSYRTFEDVPFWYVRNSFGTDWGDGGYYKHAMYPYNEITAIEMDASVTGHDYTGVIFFKVDTPPLLTYVPLINFPSFNLLRTIRYYNTSEDLVVKYLTNNQICWAS